MKEKIKDILDGIKVSLDDLKGILVFNFKDIWAILNTDFIIYWFIWVFLFMVLPFLNVVSLVFIFFFLSFSLRYFLRLVLEDPESLKFFVSPSDFTNNSFIEDMFRDLKWGYVKEVFFNSLFVLLFFLFLILFFSFLVYLFIFLLKLNFFLKSLVMFVVVLSLIIIVFLLIFYLLLFPLVLLKIIECQGFRDLIINLVLIYQDLYDENTAIFFRSLFFDLFWRGVVLTFIFSPFLVFFFIFYKIIIANFIFALFIGWFLISLFLGLFVVFFVIDFVKNYYIYFHYV